MKKFTLRTHHLSRLAYFSSDITTYRQPVLRHVSELSQHGRHKTGSSQNILLRNHKEHVYGGK